MAETTGADGLVLLRAVYAADAPGWLRELPAIDVLRRVWVQNFVPTEHRVELLAPTRPDVKWQAQEQQGFDAQSFQIDWDNQQAACPEGHTSISWTPAVDNRHTAVIKFKFSLHDCMLCASRSKCIRSRKRYQRRTITIRPKEHVLALKMHRKRELTPKYTAEYARRAGIEATISQGVRVLRLGRSRYFSLARTHLSHILTATGLNFVRVADWLADIPLAGTRPSHFAALMATSEYA